MGKLDVQERRFMRKAKIMETSFLRLRKDNCRRCQTWKK
jgi:hypothetical protein